MQKSETSLWRSSELIQDKNSLVGFEAKYLKYLHSPDSKLLIFDAETKSNQKKVLEETDLYSQCVIAHL